MEENRQDDDSIVTTVLETSLSGDSQPIESQLHGVDSQPVELQAMTDTHADQPTSCK